MLTLHLPRPALQHAQVSAAMKAMAMATTRPCAGRCHMIQEHLTRLLAQLHGNMQTALMQIMIAGLIGANLILTVSAPQLYAHSVHAQHMAIRGAVAMMFNSARTMAAGFLGIHALLEKYARMGVA